ncbi:Spindle pole body-associated protein [Hirschfeldia incana]|nr:Spindle pole body-associated protein [Hirschfeldia incana]
MGSLSISTVPLSPFRIQTQTRFTMISTRTNIHSLNLKQTRSCTKVLGLGGNRREQNDSRFVDENGGVDDMEGYLDHLSLEYDSVWDTKPSWCQPWTIVVTGLSIVACSWAILQSVLVSSLAVGLIGAWWYIFLYSYPKSYSEMIAERRKRVADGFEDIYGKNKTS